MKIWIKRALILLFLAALAPAARWSQRALSHSFGDGDGVISDFAINHVVTALPTLVAFMIVSLCLWWLRVCLSDRRWMLSLCAVLSAFGVLNFAAEVFVRSRPKPVGDDNDDRVAYPYIEFKGSFQSGKHNALGYGGRVPEATKKQGEYRIFFVGGSTVRFGSPPIPELVEQLFRAEQFEEVQVFNFGVSGSGTGMELARLVFEVLSYQPDMIVSYSGGNDVNLPVIADPRPGYPFNFMVSEHHPLLEKDYPAAALAAYGSYLLRLLGQSYFRDRFTRAEELRRSAGWGTQAWRERIADAYARNIETSARIAGAFDSTFVAFLQPSLLTKAKPTEGEQAYLDRFMSRSARAVGAGYADWKLHDEFIRGRIRARLSAAREPGLRFIDMSDAFAGVETSTYADLIHTEQHATRLVAGRIFEVLRKLVRRCPPGAGPECGGVHHPSRF
jgi:hypothetical protein